MYIYASARHPPFSFSTSWDSCQFFFLLFESSFDACNDQTVARLIAVISFHSLTSTINIPFSWKHLFLLGSWFLIQTNKKAEIISICVWSVRIVTMRHKYNNYHIWRPIPITHAPQSQLRLDLLPCAITGPVSSKKPILSFETRMTISWFQSRTSRKVRFSDTFNQLVQVWIVQD